MKVLPVEPVLCPHALRWENENLNTFISPLRINKAKVYLPDSVVPPVLPVCGDGCFFSRRGMKKVIDRNMWRLSTALWEDHWLSYSVGCVLEPVRSGRGERRGSARGNGWFSEQAASPAEWVQVPASVVVCSRVSLACNHWMLWALLPVDNSFSSCACTCGFRHLVRLLVLLTNTAAPPPSVREGWDDAESPRIQIWAHW